MAALLTRMCSGVLPHWLAKRATLAGRGGLYLEDCGIGLPQPASNRVSGFSPHVADPEGAQRLWAVSLALLAQA